MRLSLKSVLVGSTLESECSEPADTNPTNPGDTKIMKFKLGVVLVCAAFLLPAITHAQVPVGRWEIVHTTGDSLAQTTMYPGGFSTFLRAGGTGDTYGTSSNSLCVIDDNSSNVVPSWVPVGVSGNDFQITIAVDNLGAAPNVSFVYTGTYAFTPIPGDASVSIPTITGTYYPVGNASACSDATLSSPGNFVATFLPTLESGSSSGSLDGFGVDGGMPFDSTVNATLTFSAPPVPGQIAGTVSLDSNPTFNTNACFATTSGVVNPLTINPNLSTQSGILTSIYAEGLDPQGVPTTLILNGFSANLYTTAANTNPYADQITSTEWAVAAAIGEDDSTVGTTGVANDGTNSTMVQFYNVVGGACNNAGGADAPFHFLSGTPIVKGHKKHHRKSAPRKDEPVRARPRK